MFFEEYILEQEMQAEEENAKREEKIKQLKEADELKKNDRQYSNEIRTESLENEGIFSTVYIMFSNFLNKSKEYIFRDIAENIRHQQQLLNTDIYSPQTEYLVTTRISESNFQFVNKTFIPDEKCKDSEISNLIGMPNDSHTQRKNNTSLDYVIVSSIRFSVGTEEKYIDELFQNKDNAVTKDKLENLLLSNYEIEQASDTNTIKNNKSNFNNMQKNIYVLDNQSLKETYGLEGRIYKDEIKLGKGEGTNMKSM